MKIKNTKVIGLLSLCLLLLVSFAGVANEQIFDFDDAAKRQLFQELTRELRCPKCQNQNIADSDAMISHDLRRKVYQLLQQGYNREQVIDYMKQRYGDFVYYQPPVTPVTMWLWILPVVFIAFGLWLILRSRRRQQPENVSQRLAEAEKMLEEDQ